MAKRGLHPIWSPVCLLGGSWFCQMELKISLSQFAEILPSQYEEVLDSFSDITPRDNVLSIPFEDQNYECMPYLDSVLGSKIQAISLFSGCGGLDIGTQLAGVKVISSLDIDKDAVASLMANEFFAHTSHRQEDIRNVKASDYSEILKRNNPEKLILVGGPPCQPFSKAGYWKTLSQRLGPEDPRNMIGAYLKLIDEIRPDGFILENVESILHPHNIQAILDLEETIAEMGYHYIVEKVNAIDFGVAQKRKRVFVIASKNEIRNHPSKTSNTSNRVIDWIGRFDLDDFASPNDSAEGKYLEHLKKVPPGSNYISLSSKRGYSEPYFVAGKRYWTFLLKLHPLMPSWTIIAQPGHWEGPFHWNSRRLRTEEIAAIQTFPIDYKILGSPRIQHKQIGNAVPCILGKQMIDCLVSNL